MRKLRRMNYWSGLADHRHPRSAQAVLRPCLATSKSKGVASSCGQGACNCGGGCNGECSTSCEG